MLLIIGIGVGWYFGKNINKNNTKLETIKTVEKVGNELNEEKIKEMTADEKFTIYSENMKNNLKGYYIITDDFSMDVEMLGITSCTIEDNNFKILFYGDNKYTTIGTDAINCGVTRIGQDNTVLLWQINSKGELLCALYNKDYNGNELNALNNIEYYGKSTIKNIELKKVEGLKNIISVNQEYSFDEANGKSKVVCFDIEGNMYDVI